MEINADRVIDRAGNNWKALLEYHLDLHRRSMRPPEFPFTRPWQEIGPGYCYGPAFGHWDIIHQIMDLLCCDSALALEQLLNDLDLQREDGFLPGSIWMKNPQSAFRSGCGHPPLWPMAVDEYMRLTGDRSLVEPALAAAAGQIGWFNANRKSPDGGFYYLDITERKWESGVDEGVRFDDVPPVPSACVDAVSHVYLLNDAAARWSLLRGKDPTVFEVEAKRLRRLIREELFDDRTGFFYDIWSFNDSKSRHITFDGMWPLVVGAAGADQAISVIDGYLLSAGHFFSKHPIATVSISDPAFELRMWRGPAWNSMTYWAARACVRYGRDDAAAKLLEAALDDTAWQFERTGNIWEFYHPHGGFPEDVQRKPHTDFNSPCPDYLGHNPLLAMADLWTDLRAAGRSVNSSKEQE